jgi:hypothetical protein
MRKAEFRKKAEQFLAPTYYCKTPIKHLAFFMAQQYRWEDTADPQIEDVTYHFTEQEAIEAAKKINLNLGFEAQVERLTTDYETFNEKFEFGEEFDFEDVHGRCAADAQKIHNVNTNNGDELSSNSIIIFYQHHRYMNYAYDIVSAQFVYQTNLKFEADLRNDQDSTCSIYCLHFKDLDELADSFRWGHSIFSKINKGSRIVRNFLSENNHPDFVAE